MRKYKTKQAKELLQACCNRCGKDLKVENGIIREGVFQADTTWGYFSNKDGKRHTFDLCEACYDECTKEFAITIDEKEVNELV